MSQMECGHLGGGGAPRQSASWAPRREAKTRHLASSTAALLLSFSGLPELRASTRGKNSSAHQPTCRTHFELRQGSNCGLPCQDECSGGHVGGTCCSVHRDGSVGGGRSPGPRGDNTGGRVCLLPPPTIISLSRRLVPYIVMGFSTVYEMACFLKGVLLRQLLPSFTSSRRRYFSRLLAPLMRGASFLPSFTQGRDCDINASLPQGCGCVINASWRCGAPSTGCCGAGQSGLSGPVALGPGVRALVSGQSSSPLFLPGQCA